MSRSEDQTYKYVINKIKDKLHFVENNIPEDTWGRGCRSGIKSILELVKELRVNKISKDTTLRLQKLTLPDKQGDK